MQAEQRPGPRFRVPRIGERTIEARIERKAEARAQYEQARQDGKRAALLEQERPNVFTMSVANVMPGDRLVAELEYSEVIVPEAGVYELVYPAVVGPRYGGGASPGADGWVATPYTRAGSPAPYRFAFQAHVESAVGIKEITSPSHKLDVAYLSATSADVKLAGEPEGNKDVVLRQGRRICDAALPYPDRSVDVVVAVAVLLAGFGSVLAADTVAVLVMVAPFARPAFVWTTIVKVAVAPLANVDLDAVIGPPPIDGILKAGPLVLGRFLQRLFQSAQAGKFVPADRLPAFPVARVDTKSFPVYQAFQLTIHCARRLQAGEQTVPVPIRFQLDLGKIRRRFDHSAFYGKTAFENLLFGIHCQEKLRTAEADF